MEIKVTVEAAPELMTAIDVLTATLVELVGTKEKTKPTDSAKPADKPADQPTLTLETVQARLTIYPRAENKGGQAIIKPGRKAH